MNKRKYILLIVLLLTPMVVYAKGDGTDVWVAVVFELFITVTLSLYFFKILSLLINEEKSNKIFWRLFIARIVFLLIFDLFAAMDIAILDAFLSFFGSIMVSILSANTNEKSAKNNANVLLEKSPSTESGVLTITKNPSVCSKCNGTIYESDKFCGICGTPVTKIEKVVVLPEAFDPIYSLSESVFLEEVIKKELSKLDVNENECELPSDVYKRKNILYIITLILVMIYISAIFFHFPTIFYIIGLIILIIMFASNKKFNLIKYIIKEIKARPDEDISNIVMSIKSSLIKKNNKIPFVIGAIIAVCIPLIIFYTPKILYEDMGDGVGVRFYTYGLSNFTSATIPETYNNKPVVSLRGNTFSNMFLLKKVSLPDTITEIRGQAFKNDYSLEEVNIPKNLETLGGGAFYNCSKITNIELPDTLTSLGGESFTYARSLKSIKLSENITEIRGNTFEGCYSLESITIPDKVTRIGGHAFYGCSKLKNVEISENSKLEEIGSSAFRLCDSLKNITIPENVVVNERAFKESPTSINYYTSSINSSNSYKYNDEFIFNIEKAKTMSINNSKSLLNGTKIKLIDLDTSNSDYKCTFKIINGEIEETVSVSLSSPSTKIDNIRINLNYISYTYVSLSVDYN